MRRIILTTALMLASFGGAMAAPANMGQVSGIQAQPAPACRSECPGVPASAAQPCQRRCGAAQAVARQDGRRLVGISGGGAPMVAMPRATPIIIANLQHHGLVSAGFVQVAAQGHGGPDARIAAPVASPSGEFDWQLSAAWAVSARLYADISVQMPLAGGTARLRYMF